MLRPAFGQSDVARGVAIIVPQIPLEIEHVQLVAVLKGVFLRVITQAKSMDAETMRGLMICSTWRIDGITPTLSRRDCRTTQVTRRGSNEFLVRLGVDLLLPLNQPIDISLAKYSEPDFTTDFTADAGVVYEDGILDSVDFTPKPAPPLPDLEPMTAKPGLDTESEL